MRLCASCQALHDRWAFKKWSAPKGWIEYKGSVEATKRLSVDNYNRRLRERHDLVRGQLRMIERGCREGRHVK